MPADQTKWGRDKEQAKVNRLLGLARGGSKGSKHRNVRTLHKLKPEHLTPDEVAIITEYEAELTRRGHFECIFPVKETVDTYTEFFESQR